MDEITLANIYKIKYNQYFSDDNIDYDDLNITYKVCLFKLMGFAMKHKGTEALLLLNNTNSEYMLTCNNRYDQVEFSQEMLQWLDNKINKYTFSAFHNHPDEGRFSILDLRAFIIKAKIKYLIVCTNSCRYIAMIRKERNLSIIRQKMMLMYIEHYMKKNNINPHYPAVQLIDKFRKDGIVYTYYINY